MQLWVGLCQAGLCTTVRVRLTTVAAHEREQNLAVDALPSKELEQSWLVQRFMVRTSLLYTCRNKMRFETNNLLQIFRGLHKVTKCATPEALSLVTADR